MLQRTRCGPQAALVRHGWNCFVEQILRGIFENASGISLSITNDHAARNIGRLGGYTRQLHGQRIGQRLMTIVAIDKNRSAARDRINQIFGGKRGSRPLGLIPVSAQNPVAFRSLVRLLADAAHELLRSAGIIQLDLVELRSAGNKVNVRIVESGQQQLAGRVHSLGVGPAP